MSQSPGGRCTHVGPFLNYIDLIDCLFSTTNENDVILGRSYVGPVLRGTGPTVSATAPSSSDR